MRISVSFAVTVVLLCGTIAASRVSETRRPDKLVHPLESIPLQVDGWLGSPTANPPESVEAKLLATEYLSRIYSGENRLLQLWVAYYSEQKAGESMHSPKACLPGAGWEPVDYGFTKVPIVGRTPPMVNRYVVQKDGERMQVLYWYQSRERIVASEYSGKVFLVW